jgi:hypothetical protein
MKQPNLTQYLDTADSAAGTGLWRQALPPEELRLLLAMSQSLQGVGVAALLQRLLTVEHMLRVPAVVLPDQIEVIGMDVEKSIRIIEGNAASSASDAVGTEHLRALYFPRRVVHTLDGTAVWMDEDGLLVMLNGNLPLLPDPNALVTTTAWHTWYAIPCMASQEIITIELLSGETLLVGVDFYQSADRLIFREHPLSYDATGSLTFVYRQYAPTPAAYSLRQDIAFMRQASVAQVSRRVPTVERLQQMLCDLAGLCCLEHADTIQSFTVLDTGVRYSGLSRDYLVPYDHTPVAVGTNLASGYVFGEGIKLHSRGTAGANWWQNLDWSVGLALDAVCPVPGLTMPGRPIRALGYDDNGTVRVHLFPEGTPANIARYQTWCRDQERRLPASKHLAPLLDARDPGSMDEAGDELQVDGLELLFNQVWGRRVIIADIRNSVPMRVVAALREWCPTTAVLLIRHLPDLP